MQLGQQAALADQLHGHLDDLALAHEGRHAARQAQQLGGALLVLRGGRGWEAVVVLLRAWRGRGRGMLMRQLAALARSPL